LLKKFFFQFPQPRKNLSVQLQIMTLWAVGNSKFYLKKHFKI